MTSDPTRHSEDKNAAQQQVLSLFLRSEREVFQYVAALVADAAAFASLFNLQAKSAIAESRRCKQWRAASVRLSREPSLLVWFASNTRPTGGCRSRY